MGTRSAIGGPITADKVSWLRYKIRKLKKVVARKQKELRKLQGHLVGIKS